MKNLFILSEEEKNRILNLHIESTKKHYLSEQSTPQTEVLITKNDKAFDYKKVGDKYYFKGKENTKYGNQYKDWQEHPEERGRKAIEALFIKNPQGDTPVKTTPETKTVTSNTTSQPVVPSKETQSQGVPQILSTPGEKSSSVTSTTTTTQPTTTTNTSTTGQNENPNGEEYVMKVQDTMATNK